MNFVERGVSAPNNSTTADIPVRRRPERKWLISYRSIEPLAIAVDVAVIFISALLSGVIYHFATSGNPGDILSYIGSAAAVSALFVSLLIGRELYQPSELIEFKEQIHSVAVTWIGVFLFLGGVIFALKIGAEFSRGAVLSFAASGLGFLITQRLVWHRVLTNGLARQKFSGRDIVLISEGLPGSVPLATLASHGFHLQQHFALPAEQSDTPRSGEILEILTYLRASAVREVVLSTELDRCTALIKRLSGLRELPIAVHFVPIGASAKILSRPSYQIGDTLCIELQREPLNRFELAVKRIMDVTCASIGLIMLLPLLIITALAIKLDSPGPILFRQKRCGFNSNQFHILKFRTMTVLEDGNSICQATRDDRRVTRLGKWLRRTSIDELPQLWNVLTGSMSLVGPRPHALAHDNEFDKVVRNYAVRHHVKPGLTGWAQVNGCRGPTPTEADIRRRVELDLWYIDNWNFRLDCWIIVRTVIEVLRGHNAY